MADIIKVVSKYAIPDVSDFSVDKEGFCCNAKTVINEKKLAIIISKLNIHSIWESGIPNYCKFCFYINELEWESRSDDDLINYMEENIYDCKEKCIERSKFLLHRVNEYNTKV